MIHADAHDRPLVSVIIPCLSHVELLANCIRSVERQKVPDSIDIIVVDAGANPEVVRTTAQFSTARVVKSAERLGPGKARNLGAREARGSILAFLDADCEAEPDWLAGALEGIDQGATLVGGPVMNARPFQWIGAADNIISFTDQGPGRPDGEAEYFPGCNIAISLADFQKSGGFPEVSILSGEDIFFCDRVKTHFPGGLRFVNRMRLRHSGRNSLAEYCRHQDRFGLDRASLNLRLRPIHRKLGKYWIMIVPIMLKRFLYVLAQSIRWNRPNLLLIVLIWPILLLGLAVWAGGFRRGCRAGITDALDHIEERANE